MIHKQAKLNPESFFKSVAFSSENTEWETPPALFRHLNLIHNFTLDVCASNENAKCDRYFTKEHDAFSEEWHGVCWMNPPYGKNIELWMKKAYQSSQKGATVVCLIPSRTDTRWWHAYAMKGKITYIRGRLAFGKNKDFSKKAPFPSAIVVFSPPEGEQVEP